jgi:Sec-independent protein translocase protein TatA
MEFLMPHDALEVITAVILFLVGVMVNALRAALKENQQAMKELSNSVAQLNVTMSKEYMSRAEAEKNNQEVWERLDRHDTRITGVSERVTRIEAREGIHG